MPTTLVRLSNQVSAEAGSCVFRVCSLCDVIFRELLCLGGVHRYGGQKRMKEFKRMLGKEEGGGEGGEINRERQKYIAVCKKPV